jgi:hypothetical protein
MTVSSRLSWIEVNQEIYRQWSPTAACAMLPFDLSDAGFLGNIFQLTPGFVALCLEPEGVALVVARGRVVVRLRGVVRQGWVRGRCRGRIPLD